MILSVCYWDGNDGPRYCYNHLGSKLISQRYAPRWSRNARVRAASSLCPIHLLAVRLRELHAARNLVIRKALTTMADQLFCTYVHARLEDHTGCHQFTPLKIRYSEDRHLTDRRMVQNDGLDLAGIDILPACDDHVLQPVQYVEIPI